MNFSTAENLLWYLNIGAGVWLAFRLIQQRLYPIYRFLTLYVLCDVMQQIAGLIVRAVAESKGPAYADVYVVGQAAKLVLSVFVALELYKRALEAHPAISAFGRRMAGYALLAASLVAIAPLALAPPRIFRSPVATMMQYLRAYERTIDLAILLLLLAMVAFLAWFPVKLARNYAYYLGGFSTFFLARWIGLFALEGLPQYRGVVSIGELAIAFVCIAGMAATMRREGEKETVAPGHAWNPAEMERLARQLEAINSSLGQRHRRAKA
jgi:hypothetical protein